MSEYTDKGPKAGKSTQSDVIHTTLYDLIYALEDATPPGDKDLIPEIVKLLVDEGRVTFDNHARGNLSI